MEFTFLDWILIGLLLVIIFIPVAWYLLTHFIYPLENEASPAAELDITIPEWSRGSTLTLLIFILTAISWTLRLIIIEITGLHRLTDAGIAITAAMLLFAIPSDLRKREFLIDWKTASRLPWGVLILLGGGLALASAISDYGRAELLATQLLYLTAIPSLLIILLVWR